MIQGCRLLSKCRRSNSLVEGLWHDDSGASLVEFALLVPFLVSLAIGIAEMSNVFFIRTALNEVVHDATRRFAVGALGKAETEKLVLKRVAETADTIGKVQVVESEVKGDNPDVTVALSVPLRDLLLFENLSGGLITLGTSNPQLTFSATMLKY